jgi:hypothetical protein
MEIKGVKLGDSETGGTAGSASLADQDSGDGEGDFVEVVGGRVGSQMTIQGARSSPRRTRSGKVIKYRNN